MPLYHRYDLCAYETDLSKGEQYLQKMNALLSSNAKYKNGDQTITDVIETLKGKHPEDFNNWFKRRTAENQPLAFNDAVSAKKFVDKYWYEDQTSGIALNWEQYHIDLERGIDTYYFNGTQLRELITKLRSDETKKFDQWFTVWKIEGGQEVFKIKSIETARAFTENTLLKNASDQDKPILLDAICYNIHQSGLNNVANTPLFDSQTAAKIEAENQGVDEFLVLEQATPEYHFSLKPNGKGIDIQSTFTYTKASSYTRYDNPYAQVPADCYDPIPLVSDGQPKVYATVTSQASLSIHKKDPNKIEIALDRVSIMVNDSRVIGLVKNNTIAQTLIDGITYFFKKLVGLAQKHIVTELPEVKSQVSAQPEATKKPQVVSSGKVEEKRALHKLDSASANTSETPNPINPSPSFRG